MRARAALLILALLAGCSERQRLNPFDPANPATRGRPSGFAALALDASVRLRWDPSTSPDLAAYRVARRAGGETEFTDYATIPAAAATFTDIGLVNGVTYEYRLYFVFSSGAISLPAEDHATPGPAAPWASDIDGARLVHLTADGRHVLETVAGGFSEPGEMACDPPFGLVWVSDAGSGEVDGVQSESSRPYRITGLSRPGTIAVNPEDHTLWVCDETAGLLRHYLPTGQAGSPASIGPVDLPLGVALDPLDASIWVCEQAGNRVRRFSAAGVQLGSVTLDSPSRLAIDSLTRDVWVTSLAHGRVVRLSPALIPQDTVSGLGGPVGVAVDPRRGRIWIADPVGSQLVALRRDATLEFRVTGLPGARMVAVDPNTGEAWAAVSNAGYVARVSPAGAVLERAGGLVTPWGVTLIP